MTNYALGESLEGKLFKELHRFTTGRNTMSLLELPFDRLYCNVRDRFGMRLQRKLHRGLVYLPSSTLRRAMRA